MPGTEDGIRPDIIVNPHAMPSRMTIGHLVETIISKVAGIYGAFGDCTAFQNKGSKHKEFGSYLTKAGFHSSGNEVLYNGMTGEQLESEIYFGPTYYLRLKHMPKDKINYRARGPRTVLTRQTVQGRANNGGLRIGEMDRDCLIAHGISQFVQESMLVRGDEYYVAICNKTGCIAAYNETKKIFLSPMADGPLKFTTNINNELNITNISKFGRDFSIIRVPYAFKLLMQELKTMNVQMRIITDANVDQLLSLTEGDDIKHLTGLDNLEQVNEIINKTAQKQIPTIKEKTPVEEVKDIKPFLPTFKHKLPDAFDENFRAVLEDEPRPSDATPDSPAYEVGLGVDDLVYVDGEGDTEFKILEEPDNEDNEYMVQNRETKELLYMSGEKMNKIPVYPSPEAAYAPTSPHAIYDENGDIVWPTQIMQTLQKVLHTISYTCYDPYSLNAEENEEDESDSNNENPEIIIKTEKQEDADISQVLDKVSKEEGREIVKTVTKINKENTTGLEKLSSIEDETSKENKEDRENTKSVTTNSE